MKKCIAFFLVLMMTLSLAACGAERETAETSAPDMQSVTTVGANESVSGGTTEAEAAVSADIAEPENGTAGTDGVKVLVAYFSATNTTEGVAEHIANGLSADLYEIVPEQPYTSSDLNYNDDTSRSSIEMNDSSSRPAISGSVENMEQYDIVFLGYPIWWGEAPRIVNTFVESYDFSGKTIVPFCTSGSSGIATSVSELQELTDSAVWLDGRRLSGGDTQDTVMEWVNSLGLSLGE